MFSLPAKYSTAVVFAPLILVALVQNVHAGCCSMNYKDCDVWWCGDTRSSCEDTCGGDAFKFLEDGQVSGNCLARWSGCINNKSGCCDGTTCTELSQYYWQCLPGEDDDTPVDDTPRPSLRPTVKPTALATARPTAVPTTRPVADPTEAPVTVTDPPADGPNCGCESCTEDVLDRVANEYKCGSRINWVIANQDKSEIDACGQVAREYPSICGACDPDTCNFPTDAPVNPTNAPVNPTNAPVKPTNAPVNPAPTPTSPPAPKGTLLTTEDALNAWEVFLGLQELTHVNSQDPPNYALVASGGAAGEGSLVVSEGQGYALLVTGAVLASWDNHAGRIDGASRFEVINSFEGYYNFWKEMCRNSSSRTGCQPGGNVCADNLYSGKSVCLPDWRHYKTGGSESTGPAPDGDQDAIVGIIMALNALENDTNKPSWYNEARKWADASCSAFFEYNVDKSRGDHRLQKLGACWGGWEGQGNNPSYFSPGSYRVMRDYQSAFPDADRDGSYEVVSSDEWDKLVATSHEVILATQCSGDGAMVPNWVTVGTDSSGNIIHTNGQFSGSGTPQYEYGSEAARTTWRVAFDAVLYPEASRDWSPYLSPFQVRLDADFDASRSGTNKWSNNAFPSCRGPNTNTDITMFDSWMYNGFVYGPTLSALVASPASVPNAQVMMDAAGQKMTDLPRGYFERSWVLLTNLILSGAMEDAGRNMNSISI